MEKYFAIIEKVDGRFFASYAVTEDVLRSDWFAGLTEAEQNKANMFMNAALIGESIEIAGARLKRVPEEDFDYDVVEVPAEIERPNWTPIELRENYHRWENLIHETESHDALCQCNLCMECFGLGELMEMFSNDEHAAAIIEVRKLAEGK